MQQWGLATVPKLPVDICSWPHSHVFKISIYGLPSSLGSIIWVCKIIFTLSRPVDSKAPGLLYWNRGAVFGKSGIWKLPCIYVSQKRGWLKCTKYMERARKSFREVLGWSPRGPHIVWIYRKHFAALCVSPGMQVTVHGAHAQNFCKSHRYLQGSFAYKWFGCLDDEVDFVETSQLRGKRYNRDDWDVHMSCGRVGSGGGGPPEAPVM